jgi:CPA2 family monovalent cation:H+ antiporter-2
LTVGVLGLGAAYITAVFGLSLALGAFVAGLIISESEYGVQALSDVLPFRVLFSGIFFTSVGMLLDFAYVAAHPLTLVGVAAAVVLGKALLVTGLVAGPLRHSLFTGMLAGLGLAQVGEFSYVLAGVASSIGLLDAEGYQLFLGASILSMVAAPFLIVGSRPLAELAVGAFGRTKLVAQPFSPPHVGERKAHAIIVGFGLGGRHLAKILKAVHLPYLILEMNGQTVRRARQDREPVLFGDGTRRDVLEHAGIRNAQAIVFSISSPTDERRGVAIARQLNPDIRILVRTRYVTAIRDLEQLGATDVIVEEYEAALELFRRVLRYYKIPINTIETELAAMRTEQYGLLRGMPKHALHLDELKFLGIHHVLDLVEVEEGSPAVGESPTSLEMRTKTAATVVAVVREAQPLFLPDPTFRFQSGDTVVLVGDGPALTLGMELFRAKKA